MLALGVLEIAALGLVVEVWQLALAVAWALLLVLAGRAHLVVSTVHFVLFWL